MSYPEGFFTDITFTPINRPPQLAISELSSASQAEPNLIRLVKPAIIVDLSSQTPLVDPVQIETETTIWTPEQALQDFQTTMKRVRSEVELNLPNKRRSIKFVPQGDLIPTDPDKLKALIERYGSAILKGSRGDCRIDDNGIFQIRIADLRHDPTTTYERILGTMAHEYGHTLGDYIEDPIFEEMKAEAFKLIFLRIYNDCDIYLQDGYDPNSVHEIARNRIAQLTTKGIPEEAILAHLTNKKFGEYKPGDYKRLNGKGLVFTRTPVGIGNQGSFSLN